MSIHRSHLTDLDGQSFHVQTGSPVTRPSLNKQCLGKIKHLLISLIFIGIALHKSVLHYLQAESVQQPRKGHPSCLKSKHIQMNWVQQDLSGGLLHHNRACIASKKVPPFQ